MEASTTISGFITYRGFHPSGGSTMHEEPLNEFEAPQRGNAEIMIMVSVRKPFLPVHILTNLKTALQLYAL